jgi:hypothetical protein
MGPPPSGMSRNRFLTILAVAVTAALVAGAIIAVAVTQSHNSPPPVALGTLPPSPSASPTATLGPPATDTPSPSPTATSTPTHTATATAAPTMHTLPAPPPGGAYPPTGINVTGTGNGRVPVAPSRTFMINDAWQISYSWTCPQDISYGPGGMKPGFTATIKPGIPGLADPHDPPAEGAGPWGSAAQFEPTGGEVYLQITTISPQCKWHVVVYGTGPG